MTSRYHSTARTEILPHLPDGMRRVLDVGCGSGATIAAIRAACPPLDWAGGVELDATAASVAGAHCDQVWHGTVEAGAFYDQIDPGSLDAILCLDILEHLADPWSTVKRLTPLLAPGGRLVVSVPNIRNWKFISGLVARGDFHYRDAGLLDRTHLRFFVRSTAIELATCGGLTLLHAGPSRPFRPMEARWMLQNASFGLLTEFLVKQYLVVAGRRR